MVLHVPPRALFLGVDVRRHYGIISAKGGSRYATRELRLLHPARRVQHSEGEVASLQPRGGAGDTDPAWVADTRGSLPAALGDRERASGERSGDDIPAR